MHGLRRPDGLHSADIIAHAAYTATERGKQRVSDKPITVRSQQQEKRTAVTSSARTEADAANVSLEKRQSTA
jgi:hypothetical protein